jgi:hypothetical protein
MNEIEIDAPEGVTFTVNVYLVSASGMTAVVRMGEFKRLPPFQDTIDARALAHGLAGDDWRLMTRDEINDVTSEDTA